MLAAKLSDLDHHQPFADGGTTDPDNLSALCQRHHHAKHDAGWRVH
jgi:HNH endonuclease